MADHRLSKSAARLCGLVVAVGYCITVGIWTMPQTAFGLSDDGVALVAARMALFPDFFGPVAGLAAGALMVIDKTLGNSWLMMGIAVLGLMSPLFVPAIASP